MELLEFEPENLLEQAILDAQENDAPIAELTRLLIGSTLFSLSQTEVSPDGSGFAPILMEEEGAPLVAVFSSLERARPHRVLAEFPVQMPGRSFFLRLPPGYGAVLNPGWAAQLVLPPEGVAALKAQLKAE